VTPTTTKKRDEDSEDSPQSDSVDALLSSAKKNAEKDDN